MTPDLGETIAFAMIAAVILGSGLASSMVKRTFHSVMFLGVALIGVASLFILLGSPLIGVIQILVYVGGILTLFVFAVMFVAGDEEGETAAYVAPPRNSVWGILAALAMAGVVFWWAFSANPFGLPKVLPNVVDIYVMAANPLGGVDGWVGQGAGFTASIIYIVVLAIAGLVAWLGIRHVLYTWPGYRLLGGFVALVIMGMLLVVTVGTAAWTLSPTDANQTAANDLDAVVTHLFTTQVVAFEVLGVLLTAVMIGALVIARPLTGVSDKQRYAPITRNEVAESQRASDPIHPPTSSPASTISSFGEVEK